MLIPNVFTAAAILSALVAGIPIPANHELSQQTLSKGIDPKTNLDLSKRSEAGPSTIRKKIMVFISPYGRDKKHPHEEYADRMREQMRQKDMERERLRKLSPPRVFRPPPRKNSAFVWNEEKHMEREGLRKPSPPRVFGSPPRKDSAFAWNEDAIKSPNSDVPHSGPSRKDRGKQKVVEREASVPNEKNLGLKML